MSNDNYNSELFVAIKNKDAEQIEFLLKEKGIDPNIKDDTFHTPLYYLLNGISLEEFDLNCESELTNIIKILLKYGANPYYS